MPAEMIECEALAAQLSDRDKDVNFDVNFHVYPGTSHGFTNEENPIGAWDEAATETSWRPTLALPGTVA